MLSFWIHYLSMIYLMIFIIATCFWIVFTKKSSLLCKSIAVITFVVSLFVVFQRKTYLPFLGETVFPTVNHTAFPQKYYHFQHTIPQKNTPVVYWASTNDKWGADETPYGKYDNSGVVTSDDRGKITFSLHTLPHSYKVFGRTKAPHIHYRVLVKPGIWSEIYTFTVK